MKENDNKKVVIFIDRIKYFFPIINKYIKGTAIGNRATTPLERNAITMKMEAAKRLIICFSLNDFKIK